MYSFIIQVLAIFQEVGVNNVLYFLVFGESLLNGKLRGSNQLSKFLYRNLLCYYMYVANGN